jgi:hypothetical protein
VDVVAVKSLVHDEDTDVCNRTEIREFLIIFTQRAPTFRQIEQVLEGVNATEDKGAQEKL